MGGLPHDPTAGKQVSFPARHPDWNGRGLGFSLRAWQQESVEAAVQRLSSPGSRLCLVAPPGAGKTICGLAIAEQLGMPVTVYAPTTALVHQWKMRIHEALVALIDHAPGPPIAVHTYASGVQPPENSLIVLDEAHHTTKKWGENIGAHLNANHLVLGLTATPPYESKGWNQFVELVGDSPVVIQAPPLVREGQLCPYQDLAWPVAVDIDDLPSLRALHDQLRELENQLGPQLHAWMSNRLREDLWTLTEERFTGQSGLLVALCRLHNARGAPLPNDVDFFDPELLAEPTVHDRALVLWSFACDKSPESNQALRAMGFKLRKGGPVLAEDVAWRSLAGTTARVRGTIEVLAAEHMARGDGLRALIACDRDTEGPRLSARQILRALVSDPRTDRLDPILCTGSVFWIDDDLWPRVRERLPPLPWIEADGHHELDVTGWKTAERVAMATKFLTEGVTRCLVGTRHLLGEGWDCPAVSCVIDLTGITASVTVNQVRGRAMRPDPNDASKVASLWDVFAVAPGVADGDRMLQRFQERHQHTFGIDAEGRIRSGAARIDPVLARSAETVMSDIDSLRQRMVLRVNDTSRVAAQWAVGQDYRNARVWRVHQQQFTPEQETRIDAEMIPPTTHDAWPLSAVKVMEQELVELDRETSRTRIYGGVMGTSLAVLVPLGAVALVGPLGALLTTVTIPAGILLAYSSMRIASTRRSEFSHSVSKQDTIFRALHQSLSRIDGSIGPLRNANGHWWVEGNTAATRRFAEAAATLFGPVLHPRYLLFEEHGAVWPVPEELGARRDLADMFAEDWSEWTGPCSVMYARSDRGRELLQAIWRQGHRARQNVDVVEHWE